ncbi:hypothetical protein PINS_up016068 [Pythium insidiosum]|nr:hypothetical protein PINS_up016068 [Pythium insidiosum]
MTRSRPSKARPPISCISAALRRGLKEAAKRLERAVANFARAACASSAGSRRATRTSGERIRRHLQHKPRPGDGVPTQPVQGLVPPYAKYFTKLREADVASVFAAFHEVMSITCDVLRDDVKSSVTAGQREEDQRCVA